MNGVAMLVVAAGEVQPPAHNMQVLVQPLAASTSSHSSTDRRTMPSPQRAHRQLVVQASESSEFPSSHSSSASTCPFPQTPS